MRKLLASLLIASLPAAAALSEQDIQTAAKLRDQALQSSQAYDLVESLVVEVGPRLAGSDNNKKAEAWAINKLKSLGFDKVYTEAVTIPTWTRGTIHAEIEAPYRQHLVISALGGSVGTDENGINAEVAFFDSIDDLKAADAKAVKGKIVFINKRMVRAQDGFQYGTTVAGRSKGAVEAAKLGAKAVLIRSVGTSPHRFAHTGVMRYQEGVARIPAAAVSVPDADLIEAMVKRGQPVRLHLELSAEPGPDTTVHNVIAEVTGSEKPDEVVVISGHLDSWDEGQGAIDDGAGVAIAAAAGKLIKDLPQRPKRTIRVIFYAAEEIGLYGGYAYAEQHQGKSLAKHVLAAESDFGAGRIYRLDTRFGPEGEPLRQALAKVLMPIGVDLGNNQAGGGPDVSMLPAQGVPVVSLRQDGTYYFDYHHTPDDTLNKIKPDELAQNVAAWVAMAYLAAQNDAPLRPIPEGNFGE
ncbi:M20/M25/M40 family metallo-hydrolase [Gallaecimonas xiamenensis]|uniref:Carboxypeptidase Q n=1 Tax=Gallaecimonas xiamenensis 3-C-1 TaxID=745411 RepID=K2IZH0_9GAMM|nr:M20/M25/M40 family metallo-hydrolase [Gallaecimonas xiamenensis]EKE68278.1 peptidase M20:peptidase M28 [Gallaecimonas xiamenensis 3-C-1]